MSPRAATEQWAALAEEKAALAEERARFEEQAEAALARLEAMLDFKNGSLAEALMVVARAFPTGFTLYREAPEAARHRSVLH